MTTTSSTPDLATAWAHLRADSPERADDLATTEQQREHARITPTVVAADDRRVAFVWDATGPDGASGIDVVRRGADGHLDAAWSATGERPDTIDDVPPATLTEATTLQRVCARWTNMWNGDVDAHDLVTDDFRIWFGNHRSADDSLRGPAAMRDYVTAFRTELAGVRFREHGDFVLDTEHGRAAVLWTVTLPASARPSGAPGTGPFDLGGIDVFVFAADRIARVWSITGSRPYTVDN